MNTRAIVTIVNGEYFERMAALTHPTIQAYADRIGADFLVWNDVSAYKFPEYKKMEIGALLNTYERVLYIDTDVIIRPDAPDIFAVVPEDHLGILEESRYFDRRVTTARFMTAIGYDSRQWDGRYFNAGIYVCSRCHQNLFVMPETEWDHFRDQSWFNTLISDRKPRIFPLPYRFNRMVSLDRIYGEERLDAWFLHYAGFHVEGERSGVLELIAGDLEAWRQAAPAYQFPDNIAIVVEGDLGEQVAAEPVVRYAHDVIYRGDNLVLVSNRPELFAHLGLPTYAAFEQVPKFAKFHCRFTRETRDQPQAADAPHDFSRHQIHPTNQASYLALELEVPVAHRRPQLFVAHAVRDKVRALVGQGGDRPLVLVHPGAGLPANTFPSDVWEGYVRALRVRGYRVAIAGNLAGEELRVVDFDRSGTIDLVDRLSTAEVIALVAEAPVLVTNDSPLVQVAGTFDGWIGLISTLRHPEYALPWCRPWQGYKAECLSRGEPWMWEEYYHKPSGGRQPSLESCDEARLRQALPTPDSIVYFVGKSLDKS